MAYGGQLIIDKSSSVADNFYYTDKNVAIIAINSGKSSLIKSWFIEVSFLQMTTLLKAALSFMTVLRTVMEKNEPLRRHE